MNTRCCHAQVNTHPNTKLRSFTILDAGAILWLRQFKISRSVDGTPMPTEHFRVLGQKIIDFYTTSLNKSLVGSQVLPEIKVAILTHISGH